MTSVATLGSLERVALAADRTAPVHGEVELDGGARALYSTDASNDRQNSFGVARPTDNEPS